MFSIKDTLRRYRRVMQIARKPSKDEYLGTSKICAIGIAIIGLIGFGIFMAFVLLGL